MSMFVGRQTGDMDPSNAGCTSDFEFDEMPEDDGAFPAEDIDANNEETFGAEVSGVPDDLEKFAMQTAFLRLDDVAAPDPLTLPMPAFTMFGGLDPGKDREFKNKDFNKNIWEFNPSKDNALADDLWGYIFKPSDPEGTPSTSSNVPPSMSSNVPPSMGSNAPQPMSSNVLPSTSSNVPPSTSSDVPSFADVIKGEGPGPISRPPPKKTQNGGIPRESPFDNGAERKAPKESPPKASAPSFPGPFPAGSGVLSLSDLETRIITDSNVINRGTPPPNFAQQHRGGPLPPELAQKMAAAHAAMNRPPPLPFGMAPGHGRVPWIPGVPLMPPGMHMPPPRYPPFGVPPGALPPKNYPQPPPHHLPPNNSRHHQSFNQQYQSSNFDQMSVASDHSRGSAHRQKKPGMPSSRTISDYAFDPYAGFMSRKEREWLIRIQLMQCNGSGNPGEDDFYYHNWKMKNGIKSADKKKLEGDYYSFDVDKDRAHAYIPPSFEKTLGRPTHVTASLPRQIIDIHPSQEEDCTLEC